MIADTLAGRRRAAREAWLGAVDDLEDGWSLLDADLTPMLDAFDLGLRPGLELVAVVFAWGGRDGEGRAVALRTAEAEALRERGLPAGFDEDEDEPDLASLGDLVALGDALEGDGSPASRLNASIAIRELLAVGEQGHGRGWLDEEIVETGSDTPCLPAEDAPPPWSQWQALPGAARPWAPDVDASADVPVVRFHTVCGRGRWVMTRYTDRYGDPGGYRFSTDAEVVAEGPDGFVP